MPAVISSRATEVTLTALAWAALPLAALTVAAFLYGGEKTMDASTGATVITSVWAMIRFASRSVEKRAQRVDARQAALIRCVEKLAKPQQPGTGPHPILARPYDAA